MRICLNMIVKNEAHVLERCIRSVLPYIHCWAICDTGSTDGTQQLSRSLLADIPGELVDRPWKDFSTNRNEALDLARQHGDYALIIDADDVLEVDAGLQTPLLGADGYMLETVFGEVRYRNLVLARLDRDWHWHGVIHETLVRPDMSGVQFLPGLRIRRIGGGARSQLSARDKYLKDAETLRLALIQEPENQRYAYYLAQSLGAAGLFREAIVAFEKYLSMQNRLAGASEEMYYAQFQIGLFKERLGANPEQIVAAYMDACNCRPTRAEALFHLASFMLRRKRFALARLFAKNAADLPIPGDTVLVDSSIHEWRAREVWGVAASCLGDYADAEAQYRTLLANKRIPQDCRTRVIHHLRYTQTKSAATDYLEPQSGTGPDAL